MLFAGLCVVCCFCSLCVVYCLFARSCVFVVCGLSFLLTVMTVFVFVGVWVRCVVVFFGALWFKLFCFFSCRGLLFDVAVGFVVCWLYVVRLRCLL